MVGSRIVSTLFYEGGKQLFLGRAFFSSAVFHLPHFLSADGVEREVKNYFMGLDGDIAE